MGDVVILKNDSTKRAFWKLAIVESLISSKDGITRAANVRIANADKSNSHCLRCSLKHLYPIEVNASPIEADQSIQESDEGKDTTSKEKDDDTCTCVSKRPRRLAAATGEIIRQLNQN